MSPFTTNTHHLLMVCRVGISSYNSHTPPYGLIPLRSVTDLVQREQQLGKRTWVPQSLLPHLRTVSDGIPSLVRVSRVRMLVDGCGLPDLSVIKPSIMLSATFFPIQSRCLGGGQMGSPLH